MQKDLLQEAQVYAKQNRGRRIWRKIVQVMACVVVFSTTYALILPAITMEKDSCSLEEHTHSESCYEKVMPEPAIRLACSYLSLGVHAHTAECTDAEGAILCGMADYLVHEHNSDCVDESDAIVCQLPVIREHEHEDACYAAEETVPEAAKVHTHTELCYTTERGELICQVAETEGHSHSDACFVRGDLVCSLTEQEEHVHGDECSEIVLVCSLTVEPHVHTDGCWTQQVCQLPEDDTHTHNNACSGLILNCTLTEQPHVHSDGCYQTNSLCDLPETEGHTHDTACYESLLICERSKEATHIHSDTCYELVSVLTCELDEGIPEESTAPALETEPVCGKEVIKLHTHDEDDCYETYLDENGEEQKHLICEETVVEEHIHSESCFVTEEVPLEDVDTLTCTLAEGHVHGEGCYDESGTLICAETENHTHGEMCYGTWVLSCGLEEHTHTEGCAAETEAVTWYCGLEEHTHTEECLDTEGNLVCDLTEHVHAEDCLTEKIYYCWLTEHTHDASCLDKNGELTCGLDEHTHVAECCDYIGSLVVMIDTLPTSEEAEEKLLAYEETEDWDGYAAYQEKVSQSAWQLYYACEELTEEELEQVTNYDKLMDLAWLWSATTYAAVADAALSGITYNPEYETAEDGSRTQWTTPGDWITQSTHDLIHINEVVPDAYTIDGLVIGAKSADSVQVSFTPLYTSAPTDETATADTGFTWETLAGSGFDCTYGANLLLPSDAEGKAAIIGKSDNRPVSVTYKNIGTYNGTVIDLKISLVNYENYVDWGTGSVEEGVLGFWTQDTRAGQATYGQRLPGISVCGVSWVQVLYEFLDSDGNEVNVKGSTSFYDLDFAQAVHIRVDLDATSPKLKGIYVTDVNDSVPDLDTVNSYGTRAEQRSYFESWTTDDCVLKFSDTPPKGSGVVVYSSHGNDSGQNSEQYGDTKHAFTITFARNNINMVYSFDKGKNALNGNATADNPKYTRNANGGIIHSGVPVYTGSLEIKKEATTADVDPNKEFEFQIEFYKKSNYATLDDHLDGTFGDVTLVDGVGTFKLKSGESVKLTGIPIRAAGTPYILTEVTTEGYIVEASMTQQPADGEVETDGPYALDEETGYSYSNILYADNVMTQHQVVTFKNKDTSLYVTKELTCTDEEIAMVGDPEFLFQIMKADDSGNRTGEIYFGYGDSSDDGSGREYYVYDVQTGELVDENPRYTEAYGIFKIKAGQRAEFKDISDYSGKYYIREILDPSFTDQYEGIYVDGEKVTTYESIWNGQYVGICSPVKDFSDDDTTFTYTNHVDATKLSYLTITKIMAGGAPDGIDFDMEVLLNGEPIPEGTPYTLYKTSEFMEDGSRVEIEDNPNRTVTTAGIVTVPGGTTAQIDYILPGTTFQVSEISDSADGYTVKYDEYWGTDWITVDNTNGYVSGIVPVYSETTTDKTGSHCCVVVTNTLNSLFVQFDVYKQMLNGDQTSADVTFTAECVQALDGTGYVSPTSGKDGFEACTTQIESLIGTTVSQTVTVNGTDAEKAQFSFNFKTINFDGYTYPVKLVYKITENAPTDGAYSHDTTEYYAVFYIYKSGNSLKLYNETVYLTEGTPYPEGTVLTGDATFTNTLLGDLTLKKLVDGVTAVNEDKEFPFTVTLTVPSGTTLEHLMLPDGASMDTDGLIRLTLSHDETATIQGIPLGTQWTVQESGCDGYIVSWAGTPGSGVGDSAGGTLSAGGAAVTFTNKVGYELPQTGGVGTYQYTMGGLLLMMAAAIPLYIHSSKRRKEERPSF